MLDSAEQMKYTSLCGIGRTTPEAMIGALKYFRDRLISTAAPLKGDMYMTITAKCIEACPSHVNIPRYIDYVKDGHPDLAAGVLLHHYPLVATCGRVCVRPCEARAAGIMLTVPSRSRISSATCRITPERRSQTSSTAWIR